ncbi:MAG: SpoIIE family protein phosphatase [Spirochaetes bacterium]|nr:SpoIIE family protein phosphatase [Spirochaetota bacterium]
MIETNRNRNNDSSVKTVSVQFNSASLPREESPVVFEMRPTSIHGKVIASIASSFYCASYNTKIHDLADWFTKNNEAKSIGVVDNDGNAKGVIVRTELFNTLSTKFGRELYFAKTLESIAHPAQTFNYTENIFSIASQISQSITNPEPTYFLLVDQEGKFSGVFSTHDVLVYLSEITNKDIVRASKIQACIVPEKKSIEGKCFSLMAQSKMAKGVGGDFYTAKEYYPGRWFFALCDVSGKGMAAALVSVTIGGMVHLYDFSRGLKSLIESINEYFFNTFRSEQFVTGVFFDFDEKAGKFEFCDVGHSLLFLFRDGQIKRLRTKFENPPLGIQKDFSANIAAFSLKPNDMIISYSDGIEDQKDAAGNSYGSDRFLRIITKKQNAPFDEIFQSVLWDIKQFRQHQPQDDDISVLLFKYHGV